MVGLSEIYEFDHHLLVKHDVGRLQVKMRNLILLQVSESLSDDIAQVDLGLIGEGILILGNIVRKSGIVDEIDHELTIILILLIRIEVVLGQEH